MKFLLILLLVVIPQVVSVSKNVIDSQFKRIIDFDGTTFEIRLSTKSAKSYSSCYDLRRDGETSSFCYPSIIIPGEPKCGTSAMYSFLTKQVGIQPAKDNKEYCPGHIPTLYVYLKRFHQIPGMIYVNGCLDMQKVVDLHEMLNPKTIYIIMVRNLSDWMWAVYNFWCRPAIDEDCILGEWTKHGMFRSPTHFHDLLVMDSYSKSRKLFFSMNFLTTSYTTRIEMARNVTGILPFVMASEAMEGPDRLTHIKRLQNYINTHLGTKLNLDIAHLHLVNTGDHRGEREVAKHISAGLYEISGHQPILPATVEYINSKWKQCEYISTLAQYSYNCSTVVHT